MTEQEQHAKSYQMLLDRKTIKAKIARLEHELDTYTTSWSIMSKLSEENRKSPCRFNIDSENIEVLRFSLYDSKSPDDPQFKTAWSVSAKHFDIESIQNLLSDLNASQGELVKLQSQIRGLEIE